MTKDELQAVRAVRAVVEEYVAGTREGDAARLRRVFHPDARMTGCFRGTMLCGSPEPFFRSVEASGAAGPGYEGEIVEVAVDGRVAAATLLEKNLQGLDFVDRFHLVEEDGAWRIVSKIFHHD